MAEIVNLRRERKRRARDAEASGAADNRVKFGRTKVEQALSEAVKRRAEHHLDGHRRVPADSTDNAPADRPDDG